MVLICGVTEEATMNDTFVQEMMNRTVDRVIQVVDDSMDTLKRGGSDNRFAIVSSSAMPAMEAFILSMGLPKAVAYMAALMVARERCRLGKESPGDQVNDDIVGEFILALQEPLRKAVEL